ncbi:hypothetical protein NM208_g23 [Fusarium decemcellulare]|uniref:Uncharacterized protein n=1 Tax=Fusarium decemcellulare TaxID=57161 RepID=A0ACC1T197_9HYPO|nr:hypothetical protein NM208_g23 [Fusarium decemcellulare]
MANSDKSFRVLIAGGGVAGLVLANMLERFNIDYLILESHGNIAPAVGASIGMFPNGLRILDQIDLYEPLRGFMDYSTEVQSTRDMTGKPIVSIPSFQKHVELRHGYPLMFFDRQFLLQTAYDRLKHKDRVLLSNKIMKVELVARGVEVTTTSGSKFNGSILVGADGLHSAVRQEMYRLGAQLDPEYFPRDEEHKQACHYLCSYGIAQNVPDWVSGDQCTVLGTGHSQLVVSGPENKTYWFLFSKLPETKYGKDIPKCTQEMETEFVNKYAKLPITEKVTFGKVFAHRLSSTLTPLHEYVCEKWFFGRIICLGDSMHKPNPIGGQGGNGAIESAAELVNALLKKRDLGRSLQDLTEDDISDAFAEMQDARHVRAERIVFASHLQQSLVAFEKPGLSKFVWQLLVPLKGDEASLSLFGLTLARASRLKSLPIKDRPRAIPYNDELPAHPLQKVRLFQLGFAGLMTYLFIKALSISVLSTEVQHIVSLRSALQFISPVIVYTLEGYRLGNRGTPLALPSLFFLGIHYQGIHRVAPIYAIIHAFMSHDLPTGRFIQPELIFATLLALVLGFVPLVSAIVCPTSTIGMWFQIWSLGPLITGIMTFCMYSGWQAWNRRHQNHLDLSEAAMDRYKGKDLPLLRFTYRYFFVVQAMIHLAVLLSAQPGISLKASVAHRIDEALWLFKPNNVGVAATRSITETTWLFSNIYSAWNLRRLGYVTTSQIIAAISAISVGQVLVGPGATWLVVWYWRETVLASVQGL